MNLLPPDPHEVVIHDLRGLSAEDWGLTLEKAGFEVVQGWGSDEEAIKAAWAQEKWKDKDWIEGEYYSYVKRNGEILFSVVWIDPYSPTGCYATNVGCRS
jgi:hypothetical protein